MQIFNHDLLRVNFDKFGEILRIAGSLNRRSRTLRDLELFLDFFRKPLPDERLIGDAFHRGDLLDGDKIQRIDLDRNISEISPSFPGENVLLERFIKAQHSVIIRDLSQDAARIVVLGITQFSFFLSCFHSQRPPGGSFSFLLMSMVRASRPTCQLYSRKHAENERHKSSMVFIRAIRMIRVIRVHWFGLLVQDRSAANGTYPWLAASFAKIRIHTRQI